MTTLERTDSRVGWVRDLGRYGCATAVLTSAGALTYAELAARVAQVAADLGGTRRLVLLEARNDLGSLIGYLGALVAGHPVLVTPADRSPGDGALRSTYRPDVTLTSAGEDVLLDEHTPGSAHDLHPDLAVLLSTSGSTGSPKLVRLSVRNVEVNADQIAQALSIRPEDRAVTSLPMAYSYGLSVIGSHLARGAALVLTDLSVVDPCFWDLVRSTGTTTLAAVPYTMDLLDRVGFADMDLPSLRSVTQAGGRLMPGTVRRYAELGRRRGWDLTVMYGQTEATARISVLPPDLVAARPGTIGRPVPGGDLRVVRSAEDPDGGPGELVYTGPNVMLGYAHGPADLAEGRTLTELRTGDLGVEHADGLFEVVGRRSRFVKVVGLRVDLDQVEDVVTGELLPGVPALAVGTDGRVVVAVEGELDAGLVAAELAERVGLPRAAVVVHALETLPRLPSGKPDREAVRRLDDGHSAPRAGRAMAPAVPERDATTAVRRVLVEELGVPEVAPDDTFVGLGGDSLSYVAVSVRLEAALGDLPADWHLTRVADLESLGTTRPRRWLAPLETSIVLRAVAIVLIVGTHAQLYAWPGSAHVLIALAGFNHARFQLVGDRDARWRRQLRSLARVVVPSVALIAVAALLTGRYSLPTVLLVNSLVGEPTWTVQWHFWFVEVLVHLLLGLTALLAIPWVDRQVRRRPLALPLVLLALGLLARYEVVGTVHHTAPVLWLFAFGWLVAVVRRHWERAAVSVAVVLTVPGFFDDPQREAVIAAGVLMLAWLPSLPVPTVAHRWLGRLASASLAVYLTHWLVYPLLTPVHPGLAVLGSLVVGLAYAALVTYAPRAAAPAARRARVALHGLGTRWTRRAAVTTMSG